jgi:uncharacterized protein YecT (DUF1311 family)
MVAQLVGGIMRTVIFCFALISSFAAAQTTPQQPRPKKVLTPEQIAYQAQIKTYNAERDRLRDEANSAYSAEIAREKAGDCPNSTNTYDFNMCLSHEEEITQANYKVFVTTLRAMLALPEPAMPGESPYIGPTGPAATPAANAAAFDAAESAWHAYATAECNAVDTLWRSGTIVNEMVGLCNLRMARARLHELDVAYDMHSHR